jgi:hypothetical protein
MLDNEEYSHGRRRSVDVGGLALALENQGLGHGWGGWEEGEQGGTRYAVFFISFDRRCSSYSVETVMPNYSATCTTTPTLPLIIM